MRAVSSVRPRPSSMSASTNEHLTCSKSVNTRRPRSCRLAGGPGGCAGAAGQPGGGHGV